MALVFRGSLSPRLEHLSRMPWSHLPSSECDAWQSISKHRLPPGVIGNRSRFTGIDEPVSPMRAAPVKMIAQCLLRRRHLCSNVWNLPNPYRYCARYQKKPLQLVINMNRSMQLVANNRESNDMQRFAASTYIRKAERRGRSPCAWWPHARIDMPTRMRRTGNRQAQCRRCTPSTLRLPSKE